MTMSPRHVNALSVQLPVEPSIGGDPGPATHANGTLSQQQRSALP